MLFLDPRWLLWALCAVAAFALAASRQWLFLAIFFGGVPLRLVVKIIALLIHRPVRPAKAAKPPGER